MRAKMAAVAAAGLALGLSGCTAVDPGFGEAHRYDMALQTIDPDPVYPEDGAKPGDSGALAAEATERYRTDKVKPVESMYDLDQQHGLGLGQRPELRWAAMRRSWSNHTWRRLARSADGAVAPTVALSLFGLIVVGGVAFDYARLASMDSELQNAADQAALAAASQLDGKPGACSRAALAASGLIDNNTRFGKYSSTSGIAVTVQNEAACDGAGSIRFYQDIGKATAATDEATAKFVEVEVDPRQAFYAFTPIVAAFSSVGIKAIAFAGVGSAVCGAVPFFICSPDEPVGNTDPYRLATVAPGTGVAMLEGGTQWGPGNFGFLDQLGNGADGVKEALSSDALHANCLLTENVTTETGQMNSFRASFNMRFDFDPGNGGSCPNGPCSPSTNVRKDFVRTAGSCSWQENPANGANWQTRRYRPTDLTPLTAAKTPELMGHPRDTCHAVSQNGVCSLGRVGDGIWDRAAYFRANHPGLDWAGTAELGASVTRYATYLWEAAQEAISPNTTLASQVTADASTLSAYSTPQAGRCLYPGIAPDPDGSDRRRVSAAIVNCRAIHASTGLNGKKTIPVTEFVDIFLVEPSRDRFRCDGNADVDLNGDGDTSDPGEDKACKNKFTDSSDVYIEIIGIAGKEGGGGSGQITRRDIPYLIE